MQGKLEKLIQIVYKRWKLEQPKIGQSHPEEEDLTCFLENRLSKAEAEEIKTHLMDCDSCAEKFSVYLKLKTIETKEIPAELLDWAKNLVVQESPILEIFLRFKEKFLEIINTTGDILVGQELLPAPALRSRQIKDFKDEITILKDFKDLRVEAKIENKRGEAFSLMVAVMEKATQKIIKDLRVTLIKDSMELESYLTSTGKVTFEHVLLGKYTVEISTVDSKIASILLDIKI